jgi:hypothetical protein
LRDASGPLSLAICINNPTFPNGLSPATVRRKNEQNSLKQLEKKRLSSFNKPRGQYTPPPPPTEQIGRKKSQQIRGSPFALEEVDIVEYLSCKMGLLKVVYLLDIPATYFDGRKDGQ